ncbi:MAG: hypothetical protein IPN13_11155 [Bacteroidetes bacterium]|nr:hypothetical protein [Bacteroidota bacterium]MBK7391521.1 hypothetical protein [Bacteroidota bacterium]MBK7969465.1 hypothetical protein [Bacteroidota bacterium]MBK8874440.1 hypothetical protein [Bacteroidota bacterium]MBL0073115.1 hypothetical protein [Bacteroidota bacterium]
MLTESLLLFITSLISLNQPAEIQKKQLAGTEQQIEIRLNIPVPANVVLRGGWDGN